MSIRGPWIAVIVAAATAGFFSDLGRAHGMPALWSPIPLATTLPLLWLLARIHDNAALYSFVANAFPPLVGPVLFLATAPQLLRGRVGAPVASRAFLVLFTFLTPVYLLLAWPYGLEFQGRWYTIGISVLNGIGLVACWACLARVRRVPSFAASLTFHCAVVVWFVWLAFPWLGEVL